MSYTFYGNYFGNAPKKTPEEVIAAAKKQKTAEAAVDIATSPVRTLVKKTVKVASGEKGQVVSDEQFVRAIVLKELRDRGLLSNKHLHETIEQKIREAFKKHAPQHPHWNLPY